MHRSIAHAGVAVALAMGLVALTATRAEAYGWVHGLGERIYFMPGGPEGSYMNGCIVKTSLQKVEGGDFASLFVHQGTVNGMYSNCALYAQDVYAQNAVRVVTFNGQNLVFGPTHYPSREGPDTQGGGYCSGSRPDFCVNFAHSKGPYGQPIFGAELSAVNLNGWSRQWSISVF